MKIYVFKTLRLMSITLLFIMWISYALYMIVSIYPEEWVKRYENSDLQLFNIVLTRCCCYFFLTDVSGIPSENFTVLFLDFTLIVIGFYFYIYSQSKDQFESRIIRTKLYIKNLSISLLI